MMNEDASKDTPYLLRYAMSFIQVELATRWLHHLRPWLGHIVIVALTLAFITSLLLPMMDCMGADHQTGQSLGHP